LCRCFVWTFGFIHHVSCHVLFSSCSNITNLCMYLDILQTHPFCFS
jgi:hypothetical protein